MKEIIKNATLEVATILMYIVLGIMFFFLFIVAVDVLETTWGNSCSAFYSDCEIE